MADTKGSALTPTTTLADLDLFYMVTDPAGTPTSEVITVANARGALSQQFIPWSKPGDAALETGATRLVMPFAATLVSVQASAGTAPTGASLIFDVNKNGTTIFTTQTDRPEIAVSGNLSAAETPAVTAMSLGDYLTVDIDQIGSTIAGADVSLTVYFTVA